MDFLKELVSLPISSTNHKGLEITSSGSHTTELHRPYNVFNETNGSTWLTPNSTIGHWVKIKFPKNVCVKGYRLKQQSTEGMYANRAPYGWVLQGSKDGNSYVDIKQESNQTFNDYEYNYYSLDNDEEYMYYSFSINSLKGTTDFYGFGGLQFYTQEEKYLLKSNNKIYSLKSEEILHETKMTSTTTPAPFVASASSNPSSNYSAWKAFNGTNLGEMDCWATTTNVTSGWLQIDFGKIKTVNLVSITSRDYSSGGKQAPKIFRVLSSKDGITFKLVGAFTSEDWDVNETRTFELKSTDSKIMKIEIDKNNGDTAHIAIGEVLFSYIEGLTQLPSDSLENFINYGSSSIENFNLINNSKNYILQDTVSKNTDGLWVQDIDRKPLSIKFE